MKIQQYCTLICSIALLNIQIHLIDYQLREKHNFEDPKIRTVLVVVLLKYYSYWSFSNGNSYRTFLFYNLNASSIRIISFLLTNVKIPIENMSIVVFLGWKINYYAICQMLISWLAENQITSWTLRDTYIHDWWFIVIIFISY